MWEFVRIPGDEGLIFQILKLRCTCHNGVLTNVNVSAPVRSHHSDKTAWFVWENRPVTYLFRLSSRVFVFFYKRMTNGRLLGPTCWKPVKKRSGAFMAARKFRTFRLKRSTQSLLDITASRLFIAVKFMHVIVIKTSRYSRLMTRRFDMKRTRQWMRYVLRGADKIKQFNSWKFYRNQYLII